MRSLVLLLHLATAGAGCRSSRPQVDDRTLLRREQEKLDLEEKRKLAIFDLSSIPPSNGPDAYFEKQAEQRHSR